MNTSLIAHAVHIQDSGLVNGPGNRGFDVRVCIRACIFLAGLALHEDFRVRDKVHAIIIS